MILLRRSKERQHEQFANREVWRTFHHGVFGDPLNGGFGALEFLNEDRLSPGAEMSSRDHGDVEILTVVREGALEELDTANGVEAMDMGEIQHRTEKAGTIGGARNPSSVDWTHVFQAWLRLAAPGIEPGCEKRRFTMAERRGQLRVVCSPTGQQGSLRLHQDAYVYSSLLETGHHIVHELGAGRSAWLHIVDGEAALGETSLVSGDGAGVTSERSVSITARINTEILLFDLGEGHVRPLGSNGGGVRAAGYPLVGLPRPQTKLHQLVVGYCSGAGVALS